MVPLPRLDEDDLDCLVTYPIGADEEIAEAVVYAFEAIDIDVFEKSTQLNDWINTDAFAALGFDAGRPLYLSTRIWDHRVVITAEEIRIYLPLELGVSS